MSKQYEADKAIVVYGGQWGSEGKGQVVAYLTERTGYDNVVGVRVGGPNAGHTFTAANGEFMVTQQVPIPPFVRQDAVAYIGPSAVILPDILVAELRALASVWPRGGPKVIINPRAGLILPSMMEAEATLKTAIGSTGEGVGAATAAKVMRTAPLYRDLFLGSIPVLSDEDLSFLRDHTTLGDLSQGTFDLAIFEGTQGYQLSLNHSRFYPFTTSRDCGPNDILSQAGYSERSFRSTVFLSVCRTYPIRVGGNSGELPGEITWEILRERTNGYVATPEITTVTKKQRRIAEFNISDTAHMVARTRPDGVVFTFLDYIDPACAGYPNWADLTYAAHSWVVEHAEAIGAPCVGVSVGKGQSNTDFFDSPDTL